MDCVKTADQESRLLARVRMMKGDTGRPGKGWAQGWTTDPWSTPPRIDPDQIVTVHAYGRWRQGIVTKVTATKVHVVFVTQTGDWLHHKIASRFATDGRGVYVPEQPISGHRAEPVTSKRGVQTCALCGKAVRTWPDGRFPLHATVY